MPHESDGRRLGQAVGAEIGTGIERLFRRVEQQHPTHTLGQHHPNRGFGHILMGEEIELETLSKLGVVDLAHAPLPGGAGVGDQDIEAAEMLADTHHDRRHGIAIGHIASQAEAAESCRGFGHLVAIEVEQRHLGALGGEGPRRGGADTAGSAGDHHHLAGESGKGPMAELGLLKRPVFNREHLGLGDRFEGPDGLGVSDHRDGVLGDIGGDARRLGGVPKTEQAEPRREYDARHGIEGGMAVFMAREIGFIIRRKGFNSRLGAGLEILVGGRQDERRVLGADGVVGGDHAELGVASELGAIHIGAHRIAAAKIEDEALIAPFIGAVGQADEPPQDRRDFGMGAQPIGQGRRCKGLARAACEIVLGARDLGDHPAIGLTRAFAEGENPVLEQDQALGLGMAIGDIGGRLGQGEAGHDVGNQRHGLAEDFGAAPFAVRLIGDRQHRRGMAVIDVCMGQEGVQQGLDGWVGRARIQQVEALAIDHVLVAQAIQRAKGAQALQPHRGQAGGLDGGHVPARALDAEHGHVIAHDIGPGGLHRDIAAAVLHQPALSPEQPRRIDAQAHFPIGRDHGLGVIIAPQVFHRSEPHTRPVAHYLQWSLIPRLGGRRNQAPCRSGCATARPPDSA